MGVTSASSRALGPSASPARRLEITIPRNITMAVLLSAGLVALGGISAACSPEDEAATPGGDAPAKQVSPVEADTPEPTNDPEPAESAAQENARESAESYLDTTAFSRKGLIRQLEFEGYSTKDAIYAVDAVSPNWNEQAAKAAKNYLDLTSFSRSGLIEQLKFEGYTDQQAVYGVNQTGL